MTEKKMAYIYLLPLISMPLTGYCITQEKVLNDLMLGLSYTRFEVNGGKDVKFYNTEPSLGYTPELTGFEFNAVLSPQNSINVIYDNDDIKTNSLNVAGEQCNNSNVPLNFKTVEKTETEIKSVVITNQEGAKVGGEIAFNIEATAGVPLVASIKTTASYKVTAESSYAHTESRSTTNTVSYTYPSQTYTAEPHSLTRFNANSYQINFSGETAAEGALSGTVKLYPRYMKNLGNSITINHYGQENKDYPNANKFEMYSLYDVYDLIRKNSTTDSKFLIPKYIRLDDNYKTVIFTEPVTVKYKGIYSWFSRNYQDSEKLPSNAAPDYCAKRSKSVSG